MFTGAGYSNENPDVLHQFLEAILPGKPLMIVLPVDNLSWPLSAAASQWGFRRNANEGPLKKSFRTS
jgi:hypothetical protein